MAALVPLNPSKERIEAVHVIEKFWGCPECPGTEWEDQEDAIQHHIEEHQEGDAE